MIEVYGMTKTFKTIYTITNKVTAELTRIERARGFLEAATLSEDWVREMGQRALVLEAHHTTHIEGTRLILGGLTNSKDEDIVEAAFEALATAEALAGEDWDEEHDDGFLH